ncbi:MAG: hypothetical protein Q8W45_03390, partial [Candidatus Palauibacterales bacterium]|nr:hypothetical protein [Candidatus Palauibacterales bacterium]
MQPPELPPRVPVYSVPFLEATEEYRLAIVGESDSPPTDVCSWQSDLMRYLDQQRRRLLEETPPKSTSTIELLLS